MTARHHLERSVVLELDDPQASDSKLELEVFVDPEEGLAWGLWWREEDQLVAVLAASQMP